MSVYVSALQSRPEGAGVARYQREVALALLAGGSEEVTVLLPRGVRPVDLPVRRARLFELPVPERSASRIILELLAWNLLSRSSRTLISLDFATSGRWGRRLACVHDVSYDVHPGWYTSSQVAWRRNRIRALIKSRAAVACLSQASLDDVIAKYPSLASRAYVVRPVVPQLQPPSETAIQRVRELTKTATHNVLFVSTLVPHKKPDQFVRAVEWLRKRGISIHGWLIGRKGWRSNEIERIIRRSHASGSVTWLGPVHDVELAGWYRSVDLVVHCSLYEGFGFVPGEAYMLGARVLSRRLPAVVEYLGERIEYYEGQTDHELGEAILCALAKERTLEPKPLDSRTWHEVSDELLQIAGSV